MTVIDSLIDDYVAWLFTESPTLATYHGADGHDDEMPDLSAAGQARRVGRRRQRGQLEHAEPDEPAM